MLLGLQVPTNTVRDHLNALLALAKFSLSNIASQKADWKTEAKMLYLVQCFIFPEESYIWRNV